MSRKILEFQGVVTEILPLGSISVGEPIFSDPSTPNKYYRLVTTEYSNPHHIDIIKTYVVGIEEVDISQYGSPIFLPAARKKVRDGKKYFVQFQPSKNATKAVEGVPRWGNRVMYSVDPDSFERRDYMPVVFIAGIKFPDKFVVVTNKWRTLTAGELKSFIK